MAKNKLIEAIVRTDEPSNITNPDVELVQRVMDQVKARFIDERVKGLINPGTGEAMAPVTRGEAEARWERVQVPFVQSILTAHPEMAANLGLDKANLPASSEYSSTDAAVPEEDTDWTEYEQEWGANRSSRAAKDEPSLRRGESRARKLINKVAG